MRAKMVPTVEDSEAPTVGKVLTIEELEEPTGGKVPIVEESTTESRLFKETNYYYSNNNNDM